MGQAGAAEGKDGPQQRMRTHFGFLFQYRQEREAASSLMAQTSFGNAPGMIAIHNSPSDLPEPSVADLQLTRALAQALALVGARVLDHFVVAGAHVQSFAKNGQR